MKKFSALYKYFGRVSSNVIQYSVDIREFLFLRMDYSVYKEFKLKNNYNVILKIHCEKKGQTKQTKLFHILPHKNFKTFSHIFIT